MARHSQHANAASTAGSLSGSERLSDLQTVMAVISDMEIFQVHAPLHADPAAPMADLATWSAERLSRLSRWKVNRGQAKDVVRAYAKAILALNDLHEAAACAQLSPSPPTGLANSNANKVVRNTKCAGSTGPEPPSSHALAPRFKAPAPKAEVAKTLAPSSWTLRPPVEFAWAPPARVYAAVSSWLAVFRCVWHLAFFVLHWLPVVGFVVAIIVFVTDPTLILTGAWRALRVVPTAIRVWLASPSAAPELARPSPEMLRNSRMLEVADVSPPPAFAHPSLTPTPAATSPLELVLSVLSAQGGGAGLLWMYANRASLFGGLARSS